MVAHEITIVEGEGWAMLDRITGVAAGWRGGSSASGFDVVEAGARVNPISRKRGDLVKKRKKRGEKAFECLVREVDNGWPMKHVDGEETKRWRVFLFSFLFSLVWTKWRSFDSNIVHARGSEFVWNNNLYFPIAIVFLWRPPLCSRFKRKIKKEREKNVTGRYRVQEIYDKGRVGANGICEYMNVYIIIKNISVSFCYYLIFWICVLVLWESWIE